MPRLPQADMCHPMLPTVLLIAIAALATGSVGCARRGQPAPGTVKDEAARTGHTAEDFVKPTRDYFRDMDYNLVYGKKPAYTQAEIEGRNMWMVWTGGNDRLWDRLSVDSLGSFDLLKTLSSHPSLGYGRRDRFYKLGLINEPCYSEATGPDPNRFGLWLDVRDPKCEPDPFASEKDYRGVAIGARGKTVAIGSYYGEPTGVLGLRLFPNPDFDEDARKKWNSERFYN